jgi:Uma2 family endonuclease
MSTSSSVVSFENVAELLERLGNIPPARIRMKPYPGTATESDVLNAKAHEDRLCELVDGTLVQKTVGFADSFLAAEIACRIGDHAEAHDLGLVAGAAGTIRLLEGQVRMPDAAFYRWDKFPGRVLPREPVPDLAPDLAVEVLSENNTRKEMERKLREYFLAGVRLVWIVDPARRSADVYTSPDSPQVTLESQSLDGGDVLPGFRLPLAELFSRLPELPKKARSTRKKKV